MAHLVFKKLHHQAKRQQKSTVPLLDPENIGKNAQKKPNNLSKPPVIKR